MQSKLELIFPKPLMIFDDVLSEETFTTTEKWLRGHFLKHGTPDRDQDGPVGQPWNKSTGHGIGRSTISQTTQKWDPELHNNPEMKNFNLAMLDACKIFANEMGYLETADYLFIKDMWALIAGENDFVHQHIHSFSMISGAYYFDTPEEDVLIFRDFTNVNRVPDKFNSLNATQKPIPTKKNRLVLFRGDMPHGTLPNPPGTEKFCVSFNTHFDPSVIFKSKSDFVLNAEGKK